MDVTPVYESISSAYEVISSFKGRLTELTTSDFSSENPRLFLSLLVKIADALETHLFYVSLEKAKDLSKSPQTTERLEDFHDLELQISLILATVGELSTFVKYVDDPKFHPAPWGLISQFERLSRIIVNDSRVIVSPTWQYNYLYYSIDYDLKNLLNRFRILDSELYNALFSIIQDYPRFFNLSYPSIQIENVLQLADWAHELGHFVDNFEGEKATGKSRLYLSTEAISRKIRIRLSEAEWNCLEQQLLLAQQSNTQIIPLDKFNFRGTIIRHSTNVLKTWAREIFADYFAIRLFGPAALFSLCDLALFYYPDISDSFDKDHPSLRHRIKLMLDELDQWSEFSKRKGHRTTKSWKDYLPEEERLSFEASISSLWTRIQAPPNESKLASDQSDLEVPFFKALINILEPRIDEVAEIVRSTVDKYINEQMSKTSGRNCYLSPDDFIHISDHINLLKQFIPPNPINQHNDASTRDNIQLALRLNTGWFHWTAKRNYPNISSLKDFRKIKDDRIGIERLVMKSIELLEAEQWYQTHNKFDFNQESLNSSTHQLSQRTTVALPTIGGVFGRNSIKERLESQPSDHSIVITPLLDPKTQVDEASVDVRLGNEFIGTKHTRLHALDPANQGIGNQIAEYQEKYYVPFGYSFVLHPQQFVLGCTLEYISLPNDVCAIVVGRSSWGRLGLIIATASKVDPGFKGVLTLELVNLGNVPIHVYPGSRIAQLVLYSVF